MSLLEVNKITPQSGTTLTLGDTGDTINFGSGVLPNFENLTVTGDLTVDTNSLKVDSTNNRVGIGTASPTYALDVENGNTYLAHFVSTGTSAFAQLTTTTHGVTTSDGLIFGIDSNGDTYLTNRENATLRFSTNNSEAMRIDSSGRVMVSKTTFSSATDGIILAENGLGYFTVDGNRTLNLNRRTSDGEIIRFNKDNTTVGSIGTRDTGALEIGSGDVYLQFNGNNDWIKPVDGAGNNKSGVDLGTTGAKFDNAYFGGTVNSADLDVTVGSAGDGLQMTAAGDHYINLGADSNRSGASQSLLQMEGKWNGTAVARMQFVSGTDTTNKDDAQIRFQTASAGTPSTAMTIASNGRVGIGTTSPERLLHLESAAPEIMMKDSDDNSYNTILSNGGTLSIATSAAGTLKVEPLGASAVQLASATSLGFNIGSGYNYEFDVNGSEVMRINGTTGNVGIGTNSPSFALSVSSTSSNTITAINTASNVSRFCFAENSTPSNTYTNIEGDARSSGYLAFRTNDSEKMRINSSGNVGIGTASPTFSNGTGVHVNSSTSDVRIHLTNSVTGTGSGDGAYIFSGSDSTLGILNAENADIRLYTNGTERMRINGSGNVGIGTQSAGKKLEVQGTSSNNTAVLLVENNNTSTFNSVVSEVRGGRSTTNGAYYLIQATNGNSSGVFRVFDNGDVRNTNNSYGGISDQKLKENIVDANSQWNDIKSLSIRKYSLTHENSATPTQIGVIAQELESAGMNGLVEETVDRDEEGNDLGTTTKSVKYSVLYMKSVKALQEALIKIEDLEARIEALENA